MLKKRIIPIELFSRKRLVKTKNFLNPRDVGDPVQSSKVYSDQDADELILLHIDRATQSVEKFVEVVGNIAKNCFVPLTVGGGIVHIEEVTKLISVGADKVVINSKSYCNPALLTEVASKFGRQALVVGIDIRFVNGKYLLYSDNGSRLEDASLEEHILLVESSGAGEILIQSIDEDGMMNGYNLDLLEEVSKLTTLPVIAAGGAGNFMHLKQAFDLGVDAVACGSLFNFGDNNPLRAKSFLKNYGIPLKKI